MNKRLIIALGIVIVAVVAGFLLFRQQEAPVTPTPSDQPIDFSSEQPFPNVSKVELPPPTENNISITGKVTNVSGGNLVVEVVEAVISPNPNPPPPKRTSYQVSVTDDTIIRAIVIAAGGPKEERLALSDVAVGTNLTVTGFKRGTTGIEAQLIQMVLSQ